MLVSLDMYMDRQQDYSEILYQYFTNANKQKTQHQSRFMSVIELPDVLARFIWAISGLFQIKALLTDVGFVLQGASGLRKCTFNSVPSVTTYDHVLRFKGFPIL